LVAYLDQHSEARVFAGYDVGRVHDTGEFSGLVTDPGSDIAVERVAKTFRARSFQEQEDFLVWYLRQPRTFLAIDKGGMGMQLAEKLRTLFGAARVKEVDFGSTLIPPYDSRVEKEPAKTVLAVTLKQAMLSDLVRWQVDVNKNYQMHSIRRHVTEAMRVVYRVEVEGEQKHHADVFWARAMATWMWRNTFARRLRFAAVA
jgi:phage FluMu gp28-like protein